MQPCFSTQATEHFANRFYDELPSADAIEFTGCSVKLIAKFLADLTAESDASCIEEMTPNRALPA